MKIGIITCDGNEKWTSCYKAICDSCFKRAGDAELEFFHAWKGELPTIENTRHLDALVSLGSAHMVRENLDWMADLSNFFLALEASHIKVLALCFSHQLVNKAYGGKVDYGSDFVFGADRIRFQKSDQLPRSFGTLVDKYRTDESSLLEWNLLQSHNDEVVSLGEGVELVASSKRCKNEIVLVRKNILSMQCHPDLTPKLMMEKIWPAVLRKGFVAETQIQQVEEEMLHVDTEKSLNFIRDFLGADVKT